jgi:hypothetical protein
MDHDAGARDVDWRCGPRAPGNHKGTDFAVADLTAAAATRVLAAAAGTVLGVRNDMPDVNILEGGREAIAGKECGNGLVIDHGDDLHTQYCHLRQGSVTVRSGQRVERGQDLGRVGLSGETELPHLHLSVRRHGREVDPFTGGAMDGTCGTGATAPLWDAATLAALPYEARRPYRAGFAGGPAERLAARKGDYDAPPPADAAALVLWFDGFAPRAGDSLTFIITAPDGRELFRTEKKIERDNAQWFGFAGLKRKQPRWPAGRYAGRVEWRPAEGGAPLVLETAADIP